MHILVLLYKPSCQIHPGNCKRPVRRPCQNFHDLSDLGEGFLPLAEGGVSKGYGPGSARFSEQQKHQQHRPHLLGSTYSGLWAAARTLSADLQQQQQQNPHALLPYKTVGERERESSTHISPR